MKVLINMMLTDLYTALSKYGNQVTTEPGCGTDQGGWFPHDGWNGKNNPAPVAGL